MQRLHKVRIARFLSLYALLRLGVLTLSQELVHSEGHSSRHDTILRNLET